MNSKAGNAQRLTGPSSFICGMCSHPPSQQRSNSQEGQRRSSKRQTNLRHACTSHDPIRHSETHRRHPVSCPNNPNDRTRDLIRAAEPAGDKEGRPNTQKKTKYSATRRLLLKQKLLKKAGVLLFQEQSNKVTERESTLNERVPPLKLSGLSVQELQELCKELHRKCDTVDEARYDIEAKVLKNEKELADLNAKINELKGGKRPNLKRVKKSADAMLGALTEAKLSSKSDFKSNLKTVKKDKKEEEKVDPGDWRKNVESMSGMEGRKKLFNS